MFHMLNSGRTRLLDAWQIAFLYATGYSNLHILRQPRILVLRDGLEQEGLPQGTISMSITFIIR